MSVKRINFLNRKKILQEHIRIVLSVNGAVRRFTAGLDLSSYDFPADAKVIVEAKTLLETLRFEVGRIGTGLSTGPRDISRLKSDRIVFNVLVVDTNTSRKYGHAETVRPINANGEQIGADSLLPVDLADDLNGVLWAVRFVDSDEAGCSDAPVLVFDRIAAQDSAAVFVKNTAVRAMVFPAALKEILTRILLLDRHSFEESGEGWRDAWLRFAAKRLGEDPPEVESGDNVEEAREWIERAIAQFAKSGELLRNYTQGLQQ